MSKESAPSLKLGQLREDGTIGPLEEACITRAHKTFRTRCKIDTNPTIVRMLHNGKPIDHWYYRSDQWIDQPFHFPQLGMFAYVGAPTSATKVIYSKENYIVDQEAIQDCITTTEEEGFS